MTRNIYLAGGYFTNANYGDVVQAKAWLDFYTQRGFRIKLIHAAEAPKLAEFRALLGEAPEFIHYADVLAGGEAVDSRAVFHLYGGGYLNSVWGEAFLKLLQKFAGLGVKVLSTGTQIDKAWAKTFKREMPGAADIHWLSVRDQYSREYLGSDRPILCDDSFLYFLARGSRRPARSAGGPPAAAKEMVAHFNLSDYAVEPFSKHRRPLLGRVLDLLPGKTEPASALFEELVRGWLGRGYRVTLLRNFPVLPEGVLEAERLFGDPALRAQLNIQDTFAVEQGTGSFRFGLASSFHAAIMMKVRLNIPVHFLALNNYYHQKSVALREYGVVDEDHLITRLDKLKALKDLEAPGGDNEPVIRKMTERVEVLKRAVTEVLGD